MRPFLAQHLNSQSIRADGVEILQLLGNSKGVWRLSFVLLVSVGRGDARGGKRERCHEGERRRTDIRRGANTVFVLISERLFAALQSNI